MKRFSQFINENVELEHQHIKQILANHDIDVHSIKKSNEPNKYLVNINTPEDYTEGAAMLDKAKKIFKTHGYNNYVPVHAPRIATKLGGRFPGKSVLND